MSLTSTSAAVGLALAATTSIYGLAQPGDPAEPSIPRAAQVIHVALADPGSLPAEQIRQAVPVAPLPEAYAPLFPPVTLPAQEAVTRTAATGNPVLQEGQRGPAAQTAPRQLRQRPVLPAQTAPSSSAGQKMATPASPSSAVQVHGFDGIVASERRLLQRTSSTATYQAHIASAATETEARTIWTEVATKLESRFGSVTPQLKQIEVPQHGRFVRLLGGDFGDAAQAAEFCGAVIAIGRDCRILRKLESAG